MAVLLATARADDDAIRKELDGCYAAMTKAFQQKDSKAYLAYMTDKYEVHQPNGRVLGRDVLDEALKKQIEVTSSATWDHEITKLSVDGDEAVADVTAKYLGKTKGAQDKEISLGFETTSRETWTKTSAGWRLKRVDVLTNKVTVDGKPVKER
jgi:ketosteroid isomerase-like protein